MTVPLPGEERERVARIIDPEAAWLLMENTVRQKVALGKADAIISLLYTQTGGQEKQEDSTSRSQPLGRGESAATSGSEPSGAERAVERASKHAAAMEGRALAAEELLATIGRRARSDGNRTFDECIRDLSWIDDQCRAAAASPTGREREGSRETINPEGQGSGGWRGIKDAPKMELVLLSWPEGTPTGLVNLNTLAFVLDALATLRALLAQADPIPMTEAD